MRICILGSSHVGSLKRGWDLLSGDLQHHQVTFFASRQKRIEQGLRLENGSLVPTAPKLAKEIEYTSGGLQQVSLNEYEAFVIVGLGLLLPRLDARLSAAVIEQTCIDVVTGSSSFRLAKLIRSASSSPILVVHSPQRANDADTERRLDKLDYEQTFSFMEKALDITNASLVEQPAVTLADGWNTKMEYSVGSTRLDVGDSISNELHRAADVAHMNGEFGKLWLESLLRRLSTK